MPERSIRVNDFTLFLWNFGFFLIVFSADLGLILADIYLESGGLKLVLKNFVWPKELAALLTLIGVPPSTISPAVLLGFIITVASIASSFLFAHYFVAILGSFQGFLRKLVQAKQNQQGRDWVGLIDDGYPIFKTILLTLIIGSLMFLLIFPKWTMPIAQLQLASKLWKADFQPQIQGDSIQIAQTTIPDLNLLVKKHEGEFSCHLVTGFPHGLLFLHILIALLSEIYLLHTLNHLGNFEERHSEVIHNIREKIAALFQRNGEETGYTKTMGQPAPDIPQTENINTAYQGKGEETTLNSAKGAPCGGLNEKMASSQEAFEASQKPEDQLLRVIGGGEMISPAEAEKFPELYKVVRNTDPETKEVSYEIYTNEFYERLKEQGGAS